MKRLRFVDEDGMTFYPKGLTPEQEKEAWEDHLRNDSRFEVDGRKLTPIYEEVH